MDVVNKNSTNASFLFESAQKITYPFSFSHIYCVQFTNGSSNKHVTKKEEIYT
jgi:hypothetical protein